MAKIKYSALVSDMRNKLNGSVLSKNRYGSYVRNKVTPVNPQTSFQLNQRANLATLSSGWRGLTQAQRDSWSAAAKDTPFTDIFGDIKHLTGQALYVGRNLNLLKSGNSIISSPGVSVDVPVVTAGAVGLEVTAGAVTSVKFTGIAPGSVPAGFKLVVYATPAYGPGISFVKNKYRYLGTYAVTGGVLDITADWSARFGGASIGDKASFKLALVSNTTGQLGLASSVEDVFASA